MEVQELLAKYFSGNVNSEERTTVESWKGESAENELQFIAYKEAWSNAHSDRFDVSKAFSTIEDKLGIAQQPQAKSRTLSFTFMKYAAGLVLISVVSFLAYMAIERSAKNTIADNGKTRAVEKISKLMDGTTVVLSQGAVLEEKTDFSTSQTREVTLTGKGYFDVARDEQKPFIIHTQNAKIEVLGTSFVVDNSVDETEITVESGLVSISRVDKPGSVKLKPGEVGLIRDRSAGIIKHRNDNKNYLAWKTGVLYFNRTSLGDATELLKELYGIEVTFENPKLERCKLTATFKNRKGEEIMEIIEKTFNLQVDQSGNNYKLSGKGC